MFRKEELAAEELKNVGASSWASAVLATCCLLIAGAVPFLNMLDVTSTLATDSNFIEAGISTLVVTRSDGVDLDAARCEDLNEVDGVTVAAAIDDPATVYASSRPNSPISLRQGSAHAAQMFWATPESVDTAASSVIVGASLAKDLGVASGDRLGLVLDAASSAPQVATVDHVASESSRIRGSASTVMLQGPITRASSCYVQLAVAAPPELAAVLTGWWDPAPKVSVSPLFVDASGTYVPLAQKMSARWGNWSGGVMLVAVLALCIVYHSLRRWDYALYRRLGLTTFEAAIVSTVAFVPLVLLPSFIGLALWLAVSTVMKFDAGAVLYVFRDLAPFLSGLWICLLVITLLTARVRPAEVFAER